LNLFLLRAVIGDDAFVFDESLIASHEDGSRPWDQLAHIWRSWFAIDNLSGVTAVLRSDRDKSKILIRSNETLRVADSQDRLRTLLNLGISLADNIEAGLTGLLLYNPLRDNQLEIGEISERLTAENIPLELEIAMERLGFAFLLPAKRGSSFVSTFHPTPGASSAVLEGGDFSSPLLSRTSIPPLTPLRFTFSPIISSVPS